MNILKDSKCNQQYANSTFEADSNNVMYGNINHTRGVDRKYNFL